MTGRAAGTSPAGRRAFVHVGLQKTGTSFVQSHLWESADTLRAAGIRLVPGSRDAAVALTRDLRYGDPAERLEALRSQVEDSDEPTLLLTQESLAAAGRDRARRVLDCFAGCELHLVVTVRDLARQLPSMWQQKVKAGRDESFADYLDAVLGRRGVGVRFWDQQELPAVLDRWASGLVPERVHVVTVPPGADRTLLPRRFAAVVGFDFDALSAAAPRPNLSLDPAQAELVRRVNAELDLPTARHGRTVKQFFAAQVLAPRRGEPARTPHDLADWCREVAREQVAFVRERGFDVVGDLEDLLPRDADFGPPVTVGDADVLAAAVPALAELLVRHDRDRGELDRLRRENRRLGRQLAGLERAAPPHPGEATAPSGGRWSLLSRRLRRAAGPFR